MVTRATRSPRRRTVVALAVVLAVLAGFMVRLFDIQVVNANEHIADSLAHALGGSQTLYGTRGSIVDASGQTLAGSVLEYDCQLDPLLITQIDQDIVAKKSKAKPWSEVSVQIAGLTGQDVSEVQKIVADSLAKNPKSRFAKLESGLSTQTYRALADLGEPYLACLQHPARTYPDGAVAGNVVGFVGRDGDPLEGLEMTQNSCLAARNGTLAFERGKDGVVIPGTKREQAAVNGGTLQLTINRDLQWYMQQLIGEQAQDMGAQHGAILVIETGTGKIRAAAEWPSVDPNDVSASDPTDRGSRIFRGTFEPGSTFKAITASTVIDAGGQTPTSTVVASSHERFANGASVRDSFSHPAYRYTLAGVLIDSSNAGISKFSEKVSPQTRYEYFKKFGIGDGSAVHYPGEVGGDIHPVANWDNQTTYNTAYGQGITTTMPELADAYDAIANDGVRMPLSLVESCTTADGKVITPKLPAPTRVMKESTAASMRTVLENVAMGALYSKAIKIPGYRLAVKTGTGEKADLVHGGYKAGAYYTTMIGFAPAEDPKYLVVVTLDEPTKVKSSAANATAFKTAMTQVLKTYRIMPSTTAPELWPKFG
jgi:cell division protein FtsI (penicillin-binding protein 3)